MKKLIKLFLITILSISVFSLTLACKEEKITPIITILDSASNIELVEGETYDIKATVTEGFTLSWESNNDSIVKVENGKIEGLKVGQTKIIISVLDSDVKKEITVIVSERIYDVNYIQENLNTSGYKSYYYVSQITTNEFLLKKTENRMEAKDGKYHLQTVITSLNNLDEEEMYKIEEESKTFDSEQKAIELSLQEEYFDSRTITKNSLEGIVKVDKALSLLGITNIKDIKINIVLNDDLKVQEIKIEYCDNETLYNVVLTVNFVY